MYNLKEVYNFYEKSSIEEITRIEKLISTLLENKNNIIDNLRNNIINIESYYNLSFENILNNLHLIVNTDEVPNAPLFIDWIKSLKSIDSKLSNLEKQKIELSNVVINEDIFRDITEMYMFDYIHPALINTGFLNLVPNLKVYIKKDKGRIGVDWQKSLAKRKELEDNNIPIQCAKEHKQGKDWLIKYASEYSLKLKFIVTNTTNRDSYLFKPVISSMFNYDVVTKKLVYQSNVNTISIQNNEDFKQKFSFDDIMNMNLNFYKKLILLTNLDPKLLEAYDK